MVELSCPWCAESLTVEAQPQADEQSCPECLTSWTYEDEPPLGIAAAA